MFGKGGGALGTWIKEFCELVFIQTLQAFIYALAVGLIMKMYVASMATEDQATVLGFMCVICLTAIFKVEDILRKILGFSSTKADHGSAVKSIAKTAFAMKLGSRVLDNGKKMVGGAKNMMSANKDAKKAADRLDRRMKALKEDNGITSDSDGKSVSGTGGSTQNGSAQRKIDSQKRDEKLRLFAEAQKARKMAQTESDPNKKKALIEQAKQKLQQSRAIDDTLKGGSSQLGTSQGSNTGVSAKAAAANASSSSSMGKSGGSNYKQSLLNIQEQYEKELSDAKKKRKEGFRTMTKGAVESVGAVIGGTAGGILGFADGNIDEGFQGMVSGAGAGDAIGDFATGTVFGAKDLVEGAVSVTSKAVKDYSSSIASQYEEERKNAEAQIRDLNKSAQNEVNRINKNAQAAMADLEKEVEMSAGQTARAITKAVGKGSAKAYRSRHGGIKQLDKGLSDLKKDIENSTRHIPLDNNVESID